MSLSNYRRDRRGFDSRTVAPWWTRTGILARHAVDDRIVTSDDIRCPGATPTELGGMGERVRNRGRT